MTERPNLVLRVTRKYWEQMRDGVKRREYRRVNPYWERRLVGRKYAEVWIWMGYPPASDTSKLLRFVWRGFHRETITHPHFGADPVEVFSIDVSMRVEGESK